MTYAPAELRFFQARFEPRARFFSAVRDSHSVNATMTRR